MILLERQTMEIFLSQFMSYLSLTTPSDMVNVSLSLLFLIVLAQLFLKKKSKKLNAYQKPKKIEPQPLNHKNLIQRDILTTHEKSFFPHLLEAFPDHYIFPQVSCDVLIRPEKGLKWWEYRAVRATYAQKRPDFVVCEKEDLKVVAIIELDDRTHNSKKDKIRDEFFNKIGYRVERFTAADKPWAEAIKVRFQH